MSASCLADRLDLQSRSAALKLKPTISTHSKRRATTRSNLPLIILEHHTHHHHSAYPSLLSSPSSTKPVDFCLFVSITAQHLQVATTYIIHLFFMHPAAHRPTLIPCYVSTNPLARARATACRMPRTQSPRA